MKAIFSDPPIKLNLSQKKQHYISIKLMCSFYNNYRCLKFILGGQGERGDFRLEHSVHAGLGAPPIYSFFKNKGNGGNIKNKTKITLRALPWSFVLSGLIAFGMFLNKESRWFCPSGHPAFGKVFAVDFAFVSTRFR